MKETKVASRYARSLIQLAQDKGTLDDIQKDMTLVRDVVKENRDLRLLLESPIVNQDKKEKVLHAIFQGKISDMSMKFMDILLSKRREHLIDDVAEEVARQYMEVKNTIVAEVISAVALNDSQREEVRTIVKKIDPRKVELIEKIDKDIIGGMIIRVGDQQVDYSVARQLEDYRQEFSKNTYIAEI